MISGSHNTSTSLFENYNTRDLRELKRAKWSNSGAQYGAAIAEMDFYPAADIAAAHAESAMRGDLGYAHPKALDAASDALREYLFLNYGWRISANEVITLGDLLRALEVCLAYFSAPGCPVIVPTPSYPPLLMVPRLLGRKVIESPLRQSGGRWTLNLEDIECGLRLGARLLILCNPHNPTGTVYTRDELIALSELVERYGARVFADEIHAPLVYPFRDNDGQLHCHTPYASVTEVAKNHALTGVSATKGWNLGGIKAAHLIVSNDTDMPIRKLLLEMLAHGASTAGLWATTEAYRNGGAWLNSVLVYLDGNRCRLSDMVAEHLPGVVYHRPFASYLAWLDFRRTQIGDRPAEFMLRSSGVETSEGVDFGECGSGYLRLNFGTPYPVLEETLSTMGHALRVASR
ncbi:MalY/PatB family protein [Paraburkholderia bannensis]|uniref:MalY/PatB family protein n=1 Tax=Paraburkholderia bannensis TaxID=765414 RepID=UPI002AB606A0|nr:aminotransferase class I/II-fold pyridoxal phosphate-dependent enzyme [Paraburkholderia bannensis]